MRELKVHQTSGLLAFPYNTQENLERSDAGPLVGSVSSTGELAYLARGKAIEVVKISDGSRRSACNLGCIRENVIIKCINEFAISDSRKLLLGLEVVGWKNRGLLCVYDISMSKVVRSIWLPEAVTTITTIEDVTEFDSKLTTLSNEHSKSLVVVGCKGGQVLLIKIGKMKPYDHENDLSFPAELEKINLKSLLKTNGFKIKSSTNYCIDLSGDFCSDGSFKYLDPTGKPVKVFKRDQVAVSSLLVMKQASLLVAGYSFGCFHFWDLQTLRPIFSSSYSPSMADITHLVFQEPENDPRYCCYLLVGRSPSGSSDLNLPTTMTLYQLVFEIKETNEAGQFTYRDLEAVCKRFTHQLTSDSNHLADLISIGSRIITCSTLARETKQQRLDQSTGESIDMDGRVSDTTLSYIVWESPPQEPEENHPSYHLGLFDINRWYQLQMPSSIGSAMYGSSDPVCPFFAFYSLSDVSEAILPDNLVDCFISTKSISSFSSPIYPTLEQNFWPSALAFKCTCLAERGIVKSEMLGMQRQILADLVGRGSEIFSHGYQLINLCWSAGLIPKLEVSRLDDPQTQFDCLMSVAIEHNVMGFILGCVRDWSRGEITNAGSCLRSVLQWTWKRVIKAKGVLDEHYIPLFYAEKSKMDDDVIRNLSNCTDELKRLLQVLSALTENQVSITDEGASNLSTKLTVTKCIHQYADTILFFVRSGILPESTESKQVNVKSPFDENLLFIDDYCKVIAEKICENGNDDDFGWNGQYPPPSANVVCKSLLLDIPRDDLTNFLYYWILDAAEYLKLNKLAESASYYFNISKTQKNVIEALWDIDHNYLESGVEKLIEFGPELLPEAMKAVYRFGNKSLACGIYKAKEMLSPGDNDWKLCIRILVENMAVYEAYKLQAKYRESDIAFELFQYFLEQCMKNNVMPKLFDFYLTDEDEDWLYQFLENKGGLVSKELLVVFCIKRHRYAEAIKHGACFDNQRWTYNEKSLFGGVPSRRAILHMTNEIILPMQRKLISCPGINSNLATRNDPEPLPLSSTIVKRTSADQVAHSGAIFKILQSVGANRSNPEMTTFDEPFHLPFVRSAKTPVARKRREYSVHKPSTDESPVIPERKSIVKPIVSESITSEVPIKRRKHLFYGSEAMKLLQTPPVIRNPKQLKSARNLRTPASILKRSRITTKKDDTEKSVRKRVVISDPSYSASPVQLSESPGKLPDSPSCLSPEVWKQEVAVEGGSTAKENEKEVVSDEPSEEIKRSLDFEGREESGADSKLNSLESEADVISKQDKSELEQEPDTMKNRSGETYLEEEIAIVDTTGIKEAEIRTAFGNESMTSSGYQATQVNIRDKSESDIEMVLNYEKTKETLEEAAISNKDDVEQDQIHIVHDNASNRDATVYEPISNRMDISTSQFIDSQDITLDYYEERHGILVTEKQTGPSLASEIQASEMATESQVDGDESRNVSQTQGHPTLTVEEPENQYEAARTAEKEHGDEFVLELDTDDVIDDDERMPKEVSAQEDAVESEAKEILDSVARDEIEKFARKYVEMESGSGMEKEAGQIAEGEENIDKEDEVVDVLLTGKEEVGVSEEVKIYEEVSFDEKEENIPQSIEKQQEKDEDRDRVETYSKVNIEDAKNDGNEQSYDSQQRIVCLQDSENEKLSETEQQLEFAKEMEIETEIEVDGKIDSSHEVEDVKPTEAKGEEEGKEVSGDNVKEEQEVVASRTDNNDKSQGRVGEMEFIVPLESILYEKEDKQAMLGLDLRTHLKPPLILNTPSSDLSTPDIGSANSNLSTRLSDVGTPDATSPTSTGGRGGMNLRSRYIPATGGEAVQELTEKTGKDLSDIIGQSDVTGEIEYFDSSFESHDSVLSTPLLRYSNPLVFNDLMQERGATPPKQAKKSAGATITTRSKVKERQPDAKPPSPVKTRKSHSPHKSKRRSFNTPRKSPKDAYLYTPPVTRSSAKKITPSAKPLKEIGESSLLSSSVSESPISFTPVTESGQKKKRNRLKRSSLQSPFVNSHSMTLRSRNKPEELSFK